MSNGNINSNLSACWTFPAYNHSLQYQCDQDDLLCTEGASGPLCGSCTEGYVYRGETKTCSTCGSAKTFAFTVVGIVGGILFVVAVSTLAYRNHWIDLSRLHLDSFDSGSLKV
jgi:hypothetical protein